MSEQNSNPGQPRVKIRPQDKYRTVKCALKSIIQPNVDLSILDDAMMRCHKIVIHTGEFLRLWILSYTNRGATIPLIKKNFFKMAFKALTQEVTGRSLGRANQVLYDEFIDFYDTEYRYLGYPVKIDGHHLSHILTDLITEMFTNFETNIKMHFPKYIKRYVNSSFKVEFQQALNDCPHGEKTALKDRQARDLYEIREDLMNKTLNSDPKYHLWINSKKVLILPNTKKLHGDELVLNPQKYLPGMIYMCTELERLGFKMFQFCPFRTNIVPKFVPIDTSALIDLYALPTDNKTEMMGNVMETKEIIWPRFLKLDHPILKQSNYIFDYRITTDCLSISLQMMYTDSVAEANAQKRFSLERRAQINLLCSTLTPDEAEAFRDRLKEEKKAEKERIYFTEKARKAQETEAFKRLPKVDQERIKAEQKALHPSKFPYLEDLNSTQVDNLRNNNWVVCDPGRRDLVYMKNNVGQTFHYSNKTHMKKTKRLKYQRLLKNYKNQWVIVTITVDPDTGVQQYTDIKIEALEAVLSQHNSKTCNFERFKAYIRVKNRLNEILFAHYVSLKYRKYKWYSYINRKRAETDLVRTIKKKFGKNSIIIMGDWSDKLGKTPSQLKHISTPNKALKNKLAEYMTVYNIDEYRTSCLHHINEERCGNLYLPDSDGVMRKQHSILTCKMPNNRMAHINRDYNAVCNMVKIVQSFLTDRTRPLRYCRRYKLPETVRVTNPSPLTRLPAPSGVQLRRNGPVLTVRS
jgi:hypothetical protein